MTSQVLTVLAGTILFLLIPLSIIAEARQIASIDELPDLQVHVFPSNAEVPPTGKVRVLVYAQNSAAVAFEKLVVNTFASQKVVVNLRSESTTSDQMAPGTIRIWDLDLSRDQEESVSGTLFVRFQYEVALTKNGSPSAVTRFVVVGVELRDQPVVAAADLGEADVHGTVDNLNEYNPRTAYLTIKSKVGFPVQGTVRTQAPEFVQVAVAPDTGFRLEPNEAITLKVTLKAMHSVQPGKEVVVFDVPLEWMKNGAKQSAVLTAALDVSVGVLGESALLSVFAVPSLLMLPGALLLLTRGLFLRSTFRDRAESLWLPAPMSGDFWVVAVLFCFLCPLLYRYLANQLFHTDRNYLAGYGLADIFWVWVISSVLGFLVFLIQAAWVRAASFLEERKNKAYEFSQDDAPTAFLEKWALHTGAKISLPVVKLRPEPDGKNALFVESAGTSDSWIANRINLAWKGDGGDKKDLQDQVEKLLNANGSVKELSRLIKEATAAELVDVAWDIDPPFGLRLLKDEEFKRTGSEDKLAYYKI